MTIETEQQFEAWWDEHGQFCRAGGGCYEKTFAYQAWLAAKRATDKDAVRYRWLREQQWNASNLFVVAGSSSLIRLGTDCPSRGRLDAAIDTAIADAIAARRLTP